jgi:hypothetical protein
LLFGAVVALSGCSGGSVALRSGFPPPPAPPAAGATGAGVSVSGSGGLTLGILLALIVADGIHWVASRSQEESRDSAAPQSRHPLWRPIDRGWVDRGP